MSDERPYENGDWIVHLHHGVGQVKGIESKLIGGNKSKYVKVDTSSSTMWVPLEQLSDEETFRPVATPVECEEMFSIMQEPAEVMHDNYKVRRNRIRRVGKDNSLPDIARLVRDLWARNQDKRLNQAEQTALKRYRERMLREWVIALGLTESEAEAKLLSILSETQPV